MKVYVNELPKSCKECPFNEKTLLFSNFDVKKTICTNNCKLNFNFGCKLQSLADHTKQVRKEVCEDIKKIFKKCCIPASMTIKQEDLCAILDQIQGETKC